MPSKNIKKRICREDHDNRGSWNLSHPPPPPSSTLQLTQQKGHLTSLSFQPSSCMEGRGFAVSASKGATQEGAGEAIKKRGFEFYDYKDWLESCLDGNVLFNTWAT